MHGGVTSQLQQQQQQRQDSPLAKQPVLYSMRAAQTMIRSHESTYMAMTMMHMVHMVHCDPKTILIRQPMYVDVLCVVPAGMGSKK
jgi:hypothetical protein